MKGCGLDLFDPRTTSMESDSMSSRIAAPDPDFGFAFNDSNFSDRVLRIEMVADPTDARAQPENCSTLADWVARKSKRRRGDIVKKENAICHTFMALDINVCPEEHCHQFNVTDRASDEKCEEDRMPIIEDSSSGDEAANSDDSNWSEDASIVQTVKTLHISSPILAAKSPFFYKLFSNGMKESEQRHVTLRIYESEEAAFMELLNFMYTSTLSTNVAPQLLDVLMAADKFEVASCIRHCCHMLTKLPMTLESALIFLDLPFSILMTDAVQPLIDAAKTFLAANYKDITKYQDDAMKLPLVGIEAILASDDLLVGSEDAVYDFVLKWARFHYPKTKERRDILCSRLGRYIRFPYMTCRKLKKLLSCNDFDHEFATKAVLDALFFKIESPRHQCTQALEESTTSSSSLFKERAYKYKPLKVVEFELPHPQCLVYFDLNREECANLFPSRRVYSQAFHVGGQGFFLSAHCNIDQQSSSHCFGLFLGMQEKGSVKFVIDYEFSVRSKTTEEFTSKYKGNYTFTGGKAVGYRNLFSIPWTSFMADDSLYFINGTLHLRAELTIKN